jgi:hypothetical protein
VAVCGSEGRESVFVGSQIMLCASVFRGSRGVLVGVVVVLFSGGTFRHVDDRSVAGGSGGRSMVPVAGRWFLWVGRDRVNPDDGDTGLVIRTAEAKRPLSHFTASLVEMRTNL